MYKVFSTPTGELQRQHQVGKGTAWEAESLGFITINGSYYSIIIMDSF